MNKQDILDLEIESDDFPEGMTIRFYLKALLVNLWNEGESFSGKRPFGNSGWEYDLYKPLVKAGVITGDIDEYGDIGDIDNSSGDRIVVELINECFNK